MYTELGLTDKARTVFEELAVNEFTDIPQDGVWAASITFLVEVCASLGDSDRAEVLYRLLSPYAGYAVVAERIGHLGRLRGSWGNLPPRWAGGRRPSRTSIRHWP